MRHCFFVHTQLQLIVSQMLITQKSLGDAVLILSASQDGNMANNYRMLLQDELWESIHYLENYQSIITADFFCLTRKMLARKKIATLVSLLKEKDITHVYFGDQNNITLRYLMHLLKKKQFVIRLYEEGTSHYKKMDYTQQYSFFGRLHLKAVCLYNSVFFGVKMYSVFKGIIFSSQIIERRFNLLPLNVEVYDEGINWAPQYGSRLHSILDQTLMHIAKKGLSKRMRFFLTQPLTDLSENLEYAGVALLKAYLQKEGTSDFVLVLKYHPRESNAVREAYSALLESLEVEYYIISEQFNYPIEIIADKLTPDLVISIGSSASFYMQYCLGVKTHYLYAQLQEYCKKSTIYSRKIDDYIVGFKSIENRLIKK